MAFKILSEEGHISEIQCIGDIVDGRFVDFSCAFASMITIEVIISIQVFPYFV